MLYIANPPPLPFTPLLAAATTEQLSPTTASVQTSSKGQPSSTTKVKPKVKAKASTAKPPLSVTSQSSDQPASKHESSPLETPAIVKPKVKVKASTAKSPLSVTTRSSDQPASKHESSPLETPAIVKQK